MVVVSEPSEVIPDQTFVSLSLLPAVESQPAAVVAAPLPVFGSLQSPVFTLAPPASANPTQTPLSLSVPAPVPTKDLDTPSVRVQDLAPTPAPDAAPASTLILTPVQAASAAAAPSPPTAPSEVGALYIESEDRNQVTIEDLGPDEEEDISLSQDKGGGEGKKGES